MKAVVVVFALVAAVPAFAADPADARRDPFAPFDASEHPIAGERCKESAAACVNVDDVSLKGIVSGVASPRVMVEVKGGENVVLRVGDMLAAGRIVAIRRTGVVIEQRTFSQLGGSKKNFIAIPME